MNSATAKPQKRWSKKVDAAAPAAIVVDLFGGLTPFCNACGFPTSTVQGWLEKGLIPQERWPAIKRNAARVDVALDDSHFLDQRQ